MHIEARGMFTSTNYTRFHDEPEDTRQKYRPGHTPVIVLIEFGKPTVLGDMGRLPLPIKMIRGSFLEVWKDRGSFGPLHFSRLI
jgi:hypothetical protein